MKLFDRNPLYTKSADKFHERDYIQEIVGKKYLNTLLFVYKTPEEIDWNILPNRIVLKVNQGSIFNMRCQGFSATNEGIKPFVCKQGNLDD